MNLSTELLVAALLSRVSRSVLDTPRPESAYPVLVF